LQELEGLVADGGILLPIKVHDSDGGGQSFDDDGGIKQIRIGRRQRYRQWDQVTGRLSGQMEFRLEIFPGNLDIAESHVSGTMAQQLHQSWQADTGAQHACGEGMAHLVRHDVSGDSGLGNCGAESRA
jgi:hypothetical protein